MHMFYGESGCFGETTGVVMVSREPPPRCFRTKYAWVLRKPLSLLWSDALGAGSVANSDVPVANNYGIDNTGDSDKPTSAVASGAASSGVSGNGSSKPNGKAYSVCIGESGADPEISWPSRQP